MALSVEQINTKAAKFTIFGWLVGLAYFNWFSSAAAHVSLVGHAILVIVGMFAASIIIGMGIALIMGLVTKAATGSTVGSPHGYAWGAFVSPVIAFFAADWATIFMARYS